MASVEEVLAALRRLAPDPCASGADHICPDEIRAIVARYGEVKLWESPTQPSSE